MVRTEYREEPCRSALNRVRGPPWFQWSLNPYMGCVHRCTFCYVRAFERRASRPSCEAYGRSIRVKTNVVEVLQRELGRRSWRRALVAIGTATDPYQPAEGHYRLTRGCIEALAAARTPITLITRGPLIIRDVDVLGAVAREVEVGVSLSIGTLDERAWRATEPGTAHPHQRLRAIAALAHAGIPVGVSLASVIPGITDAPESIEAVVRAAREAGASWLWGRPLDLRPGTREHFMEALGRDWPELVPGYEQLYRAAFLGKGESQWRTAVIDGLRVADGFAGQHPAAPAGDSPARQLALRLG